MKRYKGKYVATVEIDIDINPEVDPPLLTFDEMRKLTEIELSIELDRLIRDNICDDDEGCKVTVTQQQAYLNEVNDGENN